MLLHTTERFVATVEVSCCSTSFNGIKSRITETRTKRKYTKSNYSSSKE